MNVCLENVVYCEQNGLQYQLDNYAVRFRQILYFVPASQVRLINYFFDDFLQTKIF